MKKERSYSTEKAIAEYGSLYIWMRFMMIAVFTDVLLVILFDSQNKLWVVTILFCVALFIISAFYMIFHYVRYLRCYFRQE
ncbi:hypothetical protein [Bacillus cereus group sp. BfR-BA-01380]|uniref:hypothetical protein n=1 Tax=Bacillus cereus group sp. BfR-BA-01380 TaxID=2920324 RepID=UPI001F571A9C|nr:hypothetical protein [Bacillus cereus group sp. BfR-BA-01380]